MSIDSFVKRFATSGLSEPLYFYYRDGVPQCTLKFNRDTWTYYLVREDGSLEAQEGVTNTIGIIDKSPYLIPWACKVAQEKLMRTIPTRTREDGTVVTVELPITDFDTISKECKSAHKDRLSDAADVGHLAHEALEHTVKHAIEHNGGVVLALVNAPTDERALSCCQAAMKWMAAHNVRWIATERKIYSRTHKYAGTLDGLCLVDSCTDYLCCEGSASRPLFKDRLAVSDWKSSRALRVDYRYQTSSYLNALLEEFEGQTGHPIADAIAHALNNGGIDRFILRLDKENGEFEPWHLTAETYAMDLRGFLSCLQLLRDHEAVEEHTAQMRKGKTAAKRAAKADAKRLAKDAERVAKALEKQRKKTERDADKLRLKAEAKAQREAARVAKRDAKELEKAERKANRKAKPVAESLVLNAEASAVLVDALQNPPEPNAELQRAADEYTQACATHFSALKAEPAPEFPWKQYGDGYVLYGQLYDLADENVVRVLPAGESWEIAAVIHGKKYHGTRNALADAFSAADALVKAKLGTQVTQ